MMVGALSAAIVCHPTKAEPGTEETRASRLSEAMAVLDAGRLFEGMRALKRTVEEFPEFAKPYFYLSMIYTNLRQYDIAIRLSERAIELEPDGGAYYNLLGGILKIQNKHREALEQYKRALDMIWNTAKTPLRFKPMR